MTTRYYPVGTLRCKVCGHPFATSCVEKGENYPSAEVNGEFFCKKHAKPEFYNLRPRPGRERNGSGWRKQESGCSSPRIELRQLLPAMSPLEISVLRWLP